MGNLVVQPTVFLDERPVERQYFFHPGRDRRSISASVKSARLEAIRRAVAASGMRRAPQESHLLRRAWLKSQSRMRCLCSDEMDALVHSAALRP